MGGSFDTCHALALNVILSHPHEVTPWGEWSPTDPVILKMVAPSVFEAHRCWMMCAKRLGLPRYVALIVASFICTEPGWGDEDEKLLI